MIVTITPRASRAQILNARPPLYSSSSFSQHTPSRFCRAVAQLTWGSPSSFLVSRVRCGARMTQPVWPVQPAGAREASFSGRYGSPALPKMPSTKSRLETSPPGAMKRVSIRFSRTVPGTSGETIGRMYSETKHAAGSGWFAVYGRTLSISGGVNACLSSRANTGFGTPILSSGMGSPPSTMWKTPTVVRRSLAGLCSTPLTSR